MARPFDHIVIAAHDLDALADFYRRIGFQVGARNVHPWGTRNHIIQFDGVFLELIGLPEQGQVGDSTPYFARFLRDYLARKQGLAMLVLASSDAVQDHADFAADGIGLGQVFDFSRRSRKPDGREVEVAFTLAFAKPPESLDCGFFVCQQHFPENFWNPAFQIHANGAKSLNGVIFLAENTPVFGHYLQIFSHFTQEKVSGGVILTAGDQQIECLDAPTLSAKYGLAAKSHQGAGGMVALRFRIVDVAAFAQHLNREAIAFTTLQGRIIIEAATAFGANLIFEAT